MNISGILTCQRCGRETAWPMRCDCTSPDVQPAEAQPRDGLVERLEDSAHQLKSFAEAYPIEAFLPVTEDERERLGPNLITRASAEMGRHFGKFAIAGAHALREAAAALQRDTDDARLETLRGIANAKRFDRTVFDDDTSFADWAQSVARHAVAEQAKEHNDK